MVLNVLWQAFNFWSSCSSLQVAQLIGLCHQVQFPNKIFLPSFYSRSLHSLYEDGNGELSEHNQYYLAFLFSLSSYF